MSDAIQVRASGDDDTAFIFATWLRSYKHSSYFAKRITNSVFFKWHHKIVENILSRPGCEVWIACSAEDPDVILGYLVGERVPDAVILHFVFVKQEFRHIGIAKKLFHEANLPDEGVIFTHWTYQTDELLKKHPGMIYDPYRI